MTATLISATTRWQHVGSGLLLFAVLLLLPMLGPGQVAAAEEGAAKDADTKQTSDQPQKNSDDRDRSERREAMIQRIRAQLFEGIELTEAQTGQIDAAWQAAREAASAWREANQDELSAIGQKMKQARQAGDDEQFAAARNELQELMQSAPQPQEVLDNIRELLTESQRPTYDENRTRLRERWRDRSRGSDSDADKPKDDGKAAGKSDKAEG